MITLYYTLIAYTIYLALVALHEAGHWLALRFMGFGWHEFQVGPVVLERRGAETHLVYSSRWLGGMVRPKLGISKKFTVKQAVVFLLAGGVVNFVAGLLMIMAFTLMSPPNRDIYWPIILAAVISFYLAFSNLMPVKGRVGGLSSDGLQLLRLWRSRRQSRSKQD